MNKKSIIIVAVVIAVLIFVFYVYSNTTKDSMEEVKMDQKIESTEVMENSYIDIEPAGAYEMIMADSDLVIIDVSPRYAQGHIPGAINYYVGDGTLDKAIPSLDKEKTYLVYCHVDSASISGSKKLIAAGFEKVYRLNGNYSPWLKAGYPIEVEIQAVGDYSGTALAERSFLDGKFNHKVMAKIGDPAEGKFYEGWLVKGISFFSTGKMEKKDEMYVLEYMSDEDSRNFKDIVITEETLASGLDGKPEAHVLEGKFE